MREIGDHDELVTRCDADTLCLWAAQGLDGRCRAWRNADGRAVAVAGPGLSNRDRLAVRGEPDAAVALVPEVLELTPGHAGRAWAGTSARSCSPRPCAVMRRRR
jgi:hypothetical protein